jgi:hypothetical protein
MARAVANRSAPRYGALRALADMEIMTSIRLSAEGGGRPVGVPVGTAELVSRAAAGKILRRLRR